MTGRGGEVRYAALARELAAGKTVEQAMLAAGYAAKTAEQERIRHAGRKVSPHNHPAVRAELDTIRAAAAESAKVTLEGELARLNRLYLDAHAAGKLSVARQCCMDRLKAAGLLVDRKAIGIKRIEDMNEVELAALIGEDPAGD